MKPGGGVAAIVVNACRVYCHLIRIIKEKYKIKQLMNIAAPTPKKYMSRRGVTKHPTTFPMVLRGSSISRSNTFSDVICGDIEK